MDKESVVRFYRDIDSISDKIVFISTHKDSEELMSTINKIYEVSEGKVSLMYENIN